MTPSGDLAHRPPGARARRRALLPLALLAVGGCRGACGAPDLGPVSARAAPVPCVPLAVTPPPGLAETSPMPDRAFVVTALGFGEDDDGLDLDCVRTPSGCADEFCRGGPEDGPGGEDNRLGPLCRGLARVSGTDLARETERAIATGEHPVVLRLVRPTGLRDGTAEAVEVFFGRYVEGGPPELARGPGLLRPDPDAPPGSPARFAPVSIRDGLVEAGPSRDWIPFFWTRRQVAAVPVESAYLRMRILEGPSDEALPAISDGLLAGALPPEELAGAIMDLDARTARVLPRLGPVVRALVRQQADLDLVPAGPTSARCEAEGECRPGQSCRGGRCFEPPERRDAVSFAIRFHAAAATIIDDTDRRAEGSSGSR